MTIYSENAVRKRDFPVSEAERAARVQLAASYRIFNHLGWVEMIFNHITLRVPGSEKLFLINPFGLHYSEITASSLLLIDIDGQAPDPNNGADRCCWPSLDALKALMGAVK